MNSGRYHFNRSMTVAPSPVLLSTQKAPAAVVTAVQLSVLQRALGSRVRTSRFESTADAFQCAARKVVWLRIFTETVTNMSQFSMLDL